MGFLHGKRALITGIASQRSIAWGIANAMHREGAQLAFTYPNDRMKDRVDEAANAFGSNIVLPCDVAEDAQIENLFVELGKHWDGFDILVHSIGFAPREALQGQFLDNLTREGFSVAHDISSYSLAALAKAARPMMAGRNGAILTLTYLGAERALNNYNVMGLAKASLEANVRYLALNLGPETTRVNAISAGPIKTLAARGIGDMSEMMKAHAERAPLHRNVDQLEVGGLALFLASDLSAAITGETVYVDCGYNIMGF
jgi:enoyl-[acyl-carrier protein] reductase I